MTSTVLLGRYVLWFMFNCCTLYILLISFKHLGVIRNVCTKLSQEVLLSLSTSFSLHRFVCILLRTAFFDLPYMLSLKAKYCFPSMNHKSQYSQNWILFPILKSANKGFRKPLQPGDIFFLLSGNKHALLPEAI